LIQNLVVSKPDLTVIKGKAHHVINEWLAFWMILWGVESVRKELFAKLKVGHLWIIEASVK